MFSRLFSLNWILIVLFALFVILFLDLFLRHEILIFLDLFSLKIILLVRDLLLNFGGFCWWSTTLRSAIGSLWRWSFVGLGGWWYYLTTKRILELRMRLHLRLFLMHLILGHLFLVLFLILILILLCSKQLGQFLFVLLLVSILTSRKILSLCSIKWLIVLGLVRLL